MAKHYPSVQSLNFPQYKLGVILVPLNCKVLKLSKLQVKSHGASKKIHTYTILSCERLVTDKMSRKDVKPRIDSFCRKLLILLCNRSACKKTQVNGNFANKICLKYNYYDTKERLQYRYNSVDLYNVAGNCY